MPSVTLSLYFAGAHFVPLLLGSNSGNRAAYGDGYGLVADNMIWKGMVNFLMLGVVIVMGCIWWIGFWQVIKWVFF